MNKLFDTHTHIQFTAYKDDREAVIQRASKAGVLMNVVGTQIPASKAAIALAEQNENIYASVGIHPIQHDVVDVEEEDTKFTSRGEQWDQELFEELVKHPKVVAIGETGLDRFHIRKDIAIEEVFAKQVELFMQHYQLAKAHNKPLVIHVRNAHDEMIELLTKLYAQDGDIDGTIHCFTGNWEQAQQYLKFGLHLGFTGVITFPPKKTDPKSQEKLLEVVKNMPLDRMLIETDAPYLTAQPWRGERNEPSYVQAVAEKIAEIKEISLEEAAQQTTQNAQKLFQIV